jgi:hypothetical protein
MLVVPTAVVAVLAVAGVAYVRRPDSFPYHAPVPPGAVRSPSTHAGEREYRLPPGSDLGTLTSFYGRTMPPGRSWDGMPWCDAGSVEGATVEETQWSWGRPGDRRQFVLMLLDSPDRSHGATVLMFDAPGDDTACGGQVPG